jgi:sterol desaturase/sphingolipid hydroxylase (fatty acid hydroxylase superfamily)
MNKKQKEQMKNEIQMKNVMTKKIGNWFRNSTIACLLFAILTFWAFNGMSDSFIQFPTLAVNILKWVFLIVAILTGLFAIMTFLSFRNSKKHVLGLIDQLQKS